MGGRVCLRRAAYFSWTSALPPLLTSDVERCGEGPSPAPRQPSYVTVPCTKLAIPATPGRRRHIACSHVCHGYPLETNKKRATRKDRSGSTVSALVVGWGGVGWGKGGPFRLGWGLKIQIFNFSFFLVSSICFPLCFSLFLFFVFNFVFFYFFDFSFSKRPAQRRWRREAAPRKKRGNNATPPNEGGQATPPQEKRRGKAAPPKGGEGRQHHAKEERARRNTTQRGRPSGTTQQKRREK